MRRSFRRKKPQKKIKQFRANERIFARTLVVIGENGEKLGELSKEQALAQARERGLDLVEVSPKAQPPIAKIMDYGSFRYQQEKKEKKNKAKQKSTELKTVKTSSKISEHDMEVRVKQTIKFLTAGHKVRIELQMKGREHQHPNMAREAVENIINKVSQQLPDKEIKKEQDIKRAGSKFSTIIYSA